MRNIAPPAGDLCLLCAQGSNVSQSVHIVYITYNIWLTLGECHIFSHQAQRSHLKSHLSATDALMMLDSTRKHASHYAPCSSHTVEWQAQAQMLTLFCRRVKNKISCVKLLGIFRSNYVGLIHARLLFWSQLLTCLWDPHPYIMQPYISIFVFLWQESGQRRENWP